MEDSSVELEADNCKDEDGEGDKKPDLEEKVRISGTIVCPQETSLFRPKNC